MHETKTFILTLDCLKIARKVSYLGRRYSEFYTLDEALQNLKLIEAQKNQMLKISLKDHSQLYEKSGILKLVGILIDNKDKMLSIKSLTIMVL